jgi:probable phosphoglycerate mutase
MTNLPAIPLLTRMFYFLRHGETENNRRHLIAGSLDVELNDRGRAQARAAVALIAPLGITAIYSSSLKRTRDTAQPIADALGLAVIPLVTLNERNWGEFESQPRTMRARGITPPGAETPQQFAERTLAGFALIAPVGVPLVVAHSGTYRVLCQHVGQDAGTEPVMNCHPVRFTPPAEDGDAWRVEML